MKYKGKIRAALQYAAVMVVYGFFAVMPMRVCEVVAYAVADLWRRLDGRHRRLAAGQIMERLGVDAEEAGRLVKRNYRHYALLLVEIAKLRRMPLDEIRRRTDFGESREIMMRTLSKGRGMVVVTGHIGNWEWGSVVMGMFQAVSGAIARPLDNPHLDRFVNGIRTRTGVSVWSKFHCMRRALKALREGNGFVAVVDQDGGSKGCMAPFLGKRGSTMAAPIDLAIRTGAPIYVGAVMRSGGVGRFVVESGSVHWPRRGADPVQERIRLITAINADLSHIIRNYPEQWIWIHKRWKTSTTDACRRGARAKAGAPSATRTVRERPVAV